ncbi:hypothetical protein [Roseinatronobacter monicus]|uniref:Phage terminase large subunit-like protein n=1 Tax=Roseinatronobacter monicus TaxID=393481 RepID=A0A543KES4_9RHOB|nr:hypothetical protein [Roseinatronobacter monicus]TQM93554.1 hypothetical protein BD293_2191 [Roseinatronobacter monicus]
MTVTIRDAMCDPQLFGDVFGADSFAAWRALLSGFYGLHLSDDEAATFKSLTARTEAPQGPFSELWLVVGRRGGKSHAAALLALFQAVFQDHRDKLSPGEIATTLVLAADRPQARSAMRYIAGLCEHPMIRPMVKRQNETTIEFSNRSSIEIGTASFRSVRGYTLSAVIADEIAFWHSDGASPDREIIQALRPALATLDGRLIALSSPYAKRGELWRTYKRSFGDDADTRVLVAQAPTLTMNPTLDPAIVERAKRDDLEAARAEYEAQFRSDISSFLDTDQIERATRRKPLELMPSSRHRYFAFCDPAGGGADEFTLAIGHREGDTVVVDLVRGRHGSPAEIVKEYADVLRRFDIGTIHGDRYAGRWPRDEFMRWGIKYQTSDLDRSGLYLELLARLNSGSVELPPCDRLQRQLIGLERRTSRSGRDTIDHAPGSHDDRANSIAGLVVHAKRRQGSIRILEIPGC